MRPPIRTRVLWFGAPPSLEIADELSNRDLIIAEVPRPSENDYVLSRAAVFSYDKDNRADFFGMVQPARIKTMIDHGLLVVLLGCDDNAIRIVQSKVPESPLIDDYVLYPQKADTAAMNAERIRRHEPRVACNLNLEFEGDERPLKEHDVLFRRAFADSTHITLERLSGGLSSAYVYVVYAVFPPDVGGGSLPLPFFAKVDSISRSIQEFNAYEQYVTNFVPFTQRPNLDAKRCIFGVQNGIIVGDFVENSVSLASIVRTPARRPVIHSLFDDALRGWRRQGFDPSRSSPRPTSILTFFAEDVEHWRKMHSDVLSAAAAQGCVERPEELLKRLDAQSVLTYRIGPVHGDLNTENVRARNGEAVLIDFYKTMEGPLVGDLAALEVAAAFKGVVEFIKSRGVGDQTALLAEWRREVRRIYCRDCLENVPPPHNEPARFAWLWDTCREIRLIARAIDVACLQYGYSLIAHLIREAAWYHAAPSVAAAEVYGEAYATASRLLTDLHSISEHNSTSEHR